MSNDLGFIHRFVPGNRLWSARATLAHAANWPNAESREPFGIRRGRYTPACPPYRESADARTGHPTWLSGDAPGQIVRGLNAPTTAPPA